MMTHHDLASLVVESEVVVVADRVGGTDDLGQYRVRRVLSGGGLSVGQTTTIDTTCYVQSGAPFGGTAIPALDGVVVLFLTRPPPAAGAGSDLRLVPSGLRLVAGGKVFRFEQWSNPGCYVPVPQGPDPADVLRETPAGPQMDLAGLEAAIARAVRRVATFRTLLGRAATGPELDRRREALGRFFGPPRERGFPDSRIGQGFYEDRLAVRAFEALLAQGDLAGALEVLSRMQGLRPWHAPNVTDEQLLAEAVRADAPAVRRAAAIDLVGLPSAQIAARLVELARADAAAEVRAAAIDRLAKLEGTSSDDDWARRKRRLRATLVGLLRERATAEAAPGVRIAIFECAQRWRIGLPLRGTAGVSVLARRDGDRVRYWIGVASPSPRAPVPRLERAGAACAFDPQSGWSSGSVMGGVLEARCGAGPLQLIVTTPRGTVSTPL